METSQNYEKIFLDEIIFKITFSDLINPEEKIDEFYGKIHEKFKFKEIKSTPQLSIKIENQKGIVNTTNEPSTWYFYEYENIDSSPIIIEITKEYVLLDFRVHIGKYSGFENFKKDIGLILNAISVYGIKETKNIGLRYINKLNCMQGNPLVWKDLVNDALLFTDLLQKYESPSRCMSNFIFKKNDFKINFNFGIFNTEFPNPISRKEFILDYDCICSEEISINDINDVVIKMHDTISELFEENIEENLRNYMVK